MEDLSTLGIFALSSEWPESSEEKSADVVQLALDAAGAFLQSPATTNGHSQLNTNAELDTGYSLTDGFIVNSCDIEQTASDVQENETG